MNNALLNKELANIWNQDFMFWSGMATRRMNDNIMFAIVVCCMWSYCVFSLKGVRA